MATEEQIIQAIHLAVSSTMQAMISDLPALRSGAVKGDVEQIVKRIDTFKGENLQHWKFRLLAQPDCGDSGHPSSAPAESAAVQNCVACVWREVEGTR